MCIWRTPRSERVGQRKGRTKNHVQGDEANGPLANRDRSVSRAQAICAQGPGAELLACVLPGMIFLQICPEAFLGALLAT